jgi:O-antigen ligase
LAQGAGGIIIFRGDAALACLYLVGFALAVIVGQVGADKWGHACTFESVAWLLLAGALASVWLALYQWQQLGYLGVLVADLDADARPYANFNQPNQLATLLVLGLVAAACLYDAAKFGTSTALTLTVLLGFGLAMTQSRAGLLEVAAAGALLIGKRRSLGRRLALRHLLIGLPLVLAMPLAWKAANSLLGLASVRGAALTADAGTRRIVHWSSMADAIFRHPWRGYGWNQTVLAQFAVASDHPASYEVFTYSHNLFIDLLVWNGLPLGLVLVAGLGLWFLAALRGALDSAAVLALAGVTAVFIHALLEYPLYYTYFLLPTGFLMGGISAVAMPRAVFGVPPWLAPSLLVVAGITLGVVTSDYLGLEDDVRSLRFEAARIGMDRPRRDLSQPVLMSQLAAFARFARSPEREGMSEGDLRAMDEVVQRFPSRQNIVRYAAALAINDQPSRAADVLRRICKTHSLLDCDTSKALWLALGERQPAIAKVPWPPA